jgi:hypothetical protein
VFSAIVAHFVEVHFGIAIVSTLTLFWTLAGMLVVVGMGWMGSVQPVGGPAIAMEAPLPDPTQPVTSYGRVSPSPPAGAPRGKGSKAE